MKIKDKFLQRTGSERLAEIMYMLKTEGSNHYDPYHNRLFLEETMVLATLPSILYNGHSKVTDEEMLHAISDHNLFRYCGYRILHMKGEYTYFPLTMFLAAYIYCTPNVRVNVIFEDKEKGACLLKEVADTVTELVSQKLDQRAYELREVYHLSYITAIHPTGDSDVHTYVLGTPMRDPRSALVLTCTGKSIHIDTTFDNPYFKAKFE